MRKSILPFFAIFFLALAFDVSGYQFIGIYQNDTTINKTAQAVSFYWGGNCDVDVSLYATTLSGTTLTNSWYSPDNVLKAYSQPTYENPITCRFQGNGSSSSSINDFYEGKTTTSTSENIKTWIKATYNCDPDSDNLMIYSNTDETDSFGFYPYEYINRVDSYCQNGAPGTIITDAKQVAFLINYLEDGYYTDCGDTLIKGKSASLSYSCSSQYTATTFWSVRPFDSGAFGQVNISVLNSPSVLKTGCGVITCPTNKVYLWNTETNTTTTLFLATTPYSEELFLIPDTEYWLFTGSQCVGATGGSCTFKYNSSVYEIIINGYEPDYLCGDWSDCADGIQQRNCIDQNGIAPDKIETRACIDVPSVDIEMELEDYYLQNVYICQPEWWLVACPLSLNTIQVKYPVGWSVIGDFDITGTNRANNLEISQDTSTSGSSSLKMWYIPPKPEEPVADSPTTCGNATTGRYPQIQSPYNESLFISKNVSFESPYVQFRYDIRKCESPVVQYDYTGQFLNPCGKRCYSTNCSLAPEGRYGIRLTDYVIAYYYERKYPYYFNNTLGNVTSRIKYIDGIYSSSYLDSTTNKSTLNSTSNIFRNETKINIYGKINAIDRYLCVYDGTTNLANIKMTTSFQSFNITLSNMATPKNTLYFKACNTSFTTTLDLIEVLTKENTTTTTTLMDFYDNAVKGWQNKIIDLSTLGLLTNHNYTVSVAVNPENVYDSNSHCVYLDNFRATFTESELPDCESYCQGLTYYSAKVSGDTCVFTIIDVSPLCISEVIDDVTEAENVQDILEQIMAGTYKDNYTCIGNDLYSYENGIWNIITDSTFCIQLNTVQTARLSLYDPPLFVQEILLGFGLAKVEYGYVWFFFSMFMIINYVALGIAIGVTVFLKSTDVSISKNDSDNSFIPFMVVILIVIIGSIFSGWYPLEIGIPLIVAIGLMLWKQMENIIGGKR